LLFSAILGACSDLIKIGSGVVIYESALLAACEAIGNEYYIGTIDIEDNCVVSNKCVLGINTCMEESSQLVDFTHVSAGATIPAFERWHGSIARKLEDIPHTEQTPPPETSASFRVLYRSLFLVGMIFLHLISTIEWLPVIGLFVWLGIDLYSEYTSYDY